MFFLFDHHHACTKKNNKYIAYLSIWNLLFSYLTPKHVRNEIRKTIILIAVFTCTKLFSFTNGRSECLIIVDRREYFC
jgi:hypothetical protein